MKLNINKKCEYYPCHDRVISCQFCYCPFYPCMVKNENGRGGETIIKSDETTVWDCSKCSWIHTLDYKKPKIEFVKDICAMCYFYRSRDCDWSYNICHSNCIVICPQEEQNTRIRSMYEKIREKEGRKKWERRDKKRGRNKRTI